MAHTIEDILIAQERYKRGEISRQRVWAIKQSVCGRCPTCGATDHKKSYHNQNKIPQEYGDWTDIVSFVRPAEHKQKKRLDRNV